jgi:hypothetical protein
MSGASYRQDCGAKSYNRLTKGEVKEQVSAVLYQFPTQKVAYAGDISESTADRARLGQHEISLTAFFNICQTTPELRALGKKLMGCDGPTDPAFERALHDLTTAYYRRGG